MILLKKKNKQQQWKQITKELLSKQWRQIIFVFFAMSLSVGVKVHHLKFYLLL